MKKLCLVLLLFMLPFVGLGDTDLINYELTLNKLLSIKSKRFYYQSDGKKKYDGLAEYKEFSSQYAELKMKIDKKENLEPNIKYWLFHAFVAYQTNNAIALEAFSSDLVPIVSRNKEIVIDVLNKSPFLIHSSCYLMKNHFGFEGKNKNKKEPFLDEIFPVIETTMSDENSVKLMSCFKEN